MGRRKHDFLDPLRFLEYERRRVTGLPEHVEQYGIGLVTSWLGWADEVGLGLPERLMAADALRVHLEGVSGSPDFLTRSRGLASEERALARVLARSRARTWTSGKSALWS